MTDPIIFQKGPIVQKVEPDPSDKSFWANFVYGSFAWEPSQKGMVLECLQAHQATVPGSLISVLSGPRPVPLWEPSQKGWLLDRPQAHHQYVP